MISRTGAKVGAAVLSIAAAFGAGAARGAEGVPAETRALADQLVRSGGVQAGLAVHLGCGDGKLTAALAGDGKFLVHGLDADRKLVDEARRHIQSQGLYGQVSADFCPLKRLPYADNLVNLVVVDDLSRLLKDGLELSEVARVLCPRGVALLGARGGVLSDDELKKKLADAGMKDVEIVRAGGTWAKFVKSRPEGMDEWPQSRHDGGQSAVSADSIGPLSRLQWLNGPFQYPLNKYSHYRAEHSSANGRLFCWSKLRPPNLRPDDPEGKDILVLIATDAFNGLELWRRASAGNPASLVAVGDALFTVLDGEIVVLDAQTGKTFGVLEKGQGKLLYADGVLVAAGQKLSAFDAATGRPKWEVDAGATEIVLGEGRLFAGGQKLVCRDLKTGTELWQSDTAAWLKGNGRLLFCKKGVLVFDAGDAEGKTVHAASAKDGQHLWEYRYAHAKEQYQKWAVFFADGLIWLQKWVVPDKTGDQEWVGLDPATGAVKRTLSVPKYSVYACYLEMATERYFIPGRPINFMDWKDGKTANFRGARYGCISGAIVANNLFYTSPHQCGCYVGMIKGFGAFSSAEQQPLGPESANPLTPGPALGKTDAPSADSAQAEWPTFRGNPLRSGNTTAAAIAEPELLWTVQVGDQKMPGEPLAENWRSNPLGGDRLTQPAVADGRVFVSLVESHTVAALDAKTGGALWKFAAGARLDVPPTIYRGLCLLGSRDGYVYCLRASDGELAWRFRAAPEDRKIMAFGQLESPWPVVGGVLVDGGVAYCVAGRTTEVDGGLFLYGLKPESGEVVWKKRYSSIELKDWRAGRPARQNREPFRGPADLLMGDGKVVSMGGFLNLAPGTGEEAGGFPHLRSTENSARDFGTLLDREWHRYFGYPYVLSAAWYGDIPGYLVFDESRVFGFRAKIDHPPEKGKPSPVRIGGQVFAIDKKNSKADLWSVEVKDPFQVEALALAGNVLFAAGPADRFERSGGRLWVLSTKDGKLQKEFKFDAPPVSEGLAVACGKLFVATNDGKVLCLGRK